MRSSLTAKLSDAANYSDLKVLKSGGGYYIGTTYTDPATGFTEPGSRDTGYYATEAEATYTLEVINMHPNPEQFLRTYP